MEEKVWDKNELLKVLGKLEELPDKIVVRASDFSLKEIYYILEWLSEQDIDIAIEYISDKKLLVIRTIESSSL